MYSSLVIDVRSICDRSDFKAEATQRRRNLLSCVEVLGGGCVVPEGFKELSTPGFGAVFCAFGVGGIVVLLAAGADEEDGAAALLVEPPLNVVPAACPSRFLHLVEELLRASCSREAAPGFSSAMSAYIGEPQAYIELA
jgi:hypothetical protein